MNKRDLASRFFCMLTVTLISMNLAACGEPKTIVQYGSDVNPGNTSGYSDDEWEDDEWDDEWEDDGWDDEGTAELNSRDSLKISYSDAHNIQFVNYTDPSGYFTGTLPAGWSVKTGLPPLETFDLVSYSLLIYNNENPDICVYLNMSRTGVLKSQEAYNWLNKNFPTEESKYFPVIGNISTMGFFECMGDIYGYKNFEVIENLGLNAIGSDVLDARCVSNTTGDTLRGIFSSHITEDTYIVQKDLFDYTAGTVDVGYITAYSTYYMTAPEKEFISWQPILERSISSIKFTDSFHTQRRNEWTQLMGTSQYISQTANEISDMVMDTWNNRNTSQDILSQKRSDATLGYERVYNTETGERYNAYNGFLDDYKGDLYKPVTDEMYLMSIDGYIER